MENNMVNLTIDGINVSVPAGTTILEAARKIHVHIPTLCFLKDINQMGECRMCLVEVEGRRGLATSCIQTVSEGMVVYTNSQKVRDSKRMTLDLILSNHDMECLMCTRNGNCELQRLAHEFNMTDILYKGSRSKVGKDAISPSLERDFGKCILCGRCVAVCQDVQQIGAIDRVGRGFDTRIGTVMEYSLNNVNCVFCGQCITACPTGALHEKDDTEKVWEALADPNKVVIVQTAPAVRVGLGEEFGYPIGTSVQGQMVTALRRLGFDKVFDTNTAADLTIMEEATEFLERVNNKGVLPMITSCSPGWIRFCEKNYPDQLDHLSSCKSPHQMFGAVIKSYIAKKCGYDPKNVFVVSVMPCVAKKFECSRKEMEVDGNRDVDVVITTRELARMIKQKGLDFTKLEDGTFDLPMGEASGAAVIFGTTGGVMEAALRTAADVLTGQDIKEIEYNSIRGEKGIKEASINVAGKEINICVASGTANAKKIMDEIRAGKSKYDFIEIMACPGGCVMGGGQPIKSSLIRSTVDVRALRAGAIYSLDEKNIIRKSHQNPVMKQLYDEFFEKPGSHVSHKYLHTHYEKEELYDIKK